MSGQAVSVQRKIQRFRAERRTIKAACGKDAEIMEHVTEMRMRYVWRGNLVEFHQTTKSDQTGGPRRLCVLSYIQIRSVLNEEMDPWTSEGFCCCFFSSQSSPEPDTNVLRCY